MPKGYDFDDKAARRMRKIAERKRKEKLVKKRRYEYGDEEEDEASGFNPAADIKSYWEESIGVEGHVEDETIEEEREKVNDRCQEDSST